ncbi:MAG: universal stress protein, partial [Bacteroidota bacterium]
MKTLRSILLPVDFSTISQNAYRYALLFADKVEASVDLMYCIPPSTAGLDDSPLKVSSHASQLEEAKSKMHTFFRVGLKEVMHELEEVPAINTFIRSGDLRRAIIDLAKTQKTDLIIMGTEGREDIFDQIFGTKTSFLINKAPCPVIVLPNGITYHPLKKICFATNLNSSDAFIARQLLNLLHPHRPFFHFVHIKTTEEL